MASAPRDLDDTLVTNLSWIAESHEQPFDGDWEIEMFAEPAPRPVEDFEATGVWAPPASLLRRVQERLDEEEESGRYFSLEVAEDPEEATTPPAAALRLLF